MLLRVQVPRKILTGLVHFSLGKPSLLVSLHHGLLRLEVVSEPLCLLLDTLAGGHLYVKLLDLLFERKVHP